MRVISAAVLLLLLTPLADGQDSPAKTELKSNRDKASYSIGLNIGRDLKRQGLDLSIAKLAVGIADAVAGREPQISDDEMQKIMEEFGKEHTAKRVAEFKVAAEKNKKEGEEFLADNKRKDGVIALPSGLQYQIMNEGSGPKPTLNDKVKVHYHGTLLDGTIFDSSVNRGEPLEIGVSAVIPGWTEALMLMPVGSKWKVFIPSSLAYGDNQAGRDIKPGSTLVFEMELLEILK